jgi:hypothetical protein
MCVNCLTQAEVAAANIAVTAAVLKAPVHRLLADLDLVSPPDPVARDVRTVAFLRSLAVDPVAVLGDDVVARADARTAAGAGAGAGASVEGAVGGRQANAGNPVGPALQPMPASIRR